MPSKQVLLVLLLLLVLPVLTFVVLPIHHGQVTHTAESSLRVWPANMTGDSQSVNASTLVPAHQPPQPEFASGGSGSYNYWVGAQASDSAALPNTGIQTTIEVVSQQVTGCLSFWVSEEASSTTWGQVGYYICNGDTPVAFYQIWSSGSVLVTGTIFVSAGYHEFSMYVQSGDTWAYALDGSVFGTYNMGADISSSTYPVQAMSEEGYVSGPWTPAQVEFGTAMQVLESSAWSSVQTAFSYSWPYGCSSSSLSCWGLQGNLQNSSISTDAIVVGGSAPQVAGGFPLWNSTTTSALSGQSVMLTANPSGGIPPYTVTWYAAAEAGACSTSDAPISTGPTYSPPPTASAYYCYIATDSEVPPASARSSTYLVTLALAYPAISVSPVTVEINQSALISTTTTFTGGTPPYTCQWLEEPPSTANFSDLGSPFTTGCTPSSKPSASTGVLPTSGTWAFEVQVTDALGTTVVSPSATLSVSTLIGPVLTLSCSPAPVVVGSATDCEATVQGSGSATTGSVAWSSNGPGKFSKTSCKISYGACSVKFTPTAAGSSLGLLASYGGDSRNYPSAQAYILNVTMKASETTVSCTPAGVPAASPKTITCKAKVTGYSPTGAVAWSQGGTGSVSFSGVPTTCTLSRGACSVTMTGSTAGDLNVSASYAGDPNNAASYAAASLSITKAKTKLSITCVQTSLVNGNSTTCTATVVGSYSSHAGTVTWSEGAGSGSVAFLPETCSLSAGSCSVNVTASATGKVTIEVVYAGDPNNQSSSGTAKLIIRKAT